MNKSIKFFLFAITIILMLLLAGGIFIFYETNNYEPEHSEQTLNTYMQPVQAKNVAIADTTEVYDEKKENTYKKGLFSWVPNTITQKKRKELFEVTEELEINEIYQYYEDINPDDIIVQEFAKEVSERNMDLYILVADPNWVNKDDATQMLKQIDKAVDFRNSWGEEKLKGIVFDIEPYLTDKWERGKHDVIMKNYVNNMKLVYEAAQKENLRIIICIPVWYDTGHEDELKMLIQYSDEISVMNYDRNNEYDNIKNEIEYAREFDKAITCIFEFQAVGEYGLTKTQTYHDVGIKKAEENFETIYDLAEYPNLKFAYHYLESLKELLAEGK